VVRVVCSTVLSSCGNAPEVYIPCMPTRNHADCVGNRLHRHPPQPAGTVRADAEVETRAGCGGGVTVVWN